MKRILKAAVAAALILGIFQIPALGACPTPPASPVGDTIVFDPAVPTLDNPISPTRARTPRSALAINLAVYDADCNPIQPSASNPLYVKVYGAPFGVLTPTSLVLTSGTTATFHYHGDYFPNNMTVEAWIYDPLAGPAVNGKPSGGYAMGVTQIAPENPLACRYGDQSYQLTVTSSGGVPNAPPKQFVINEAVGYADPSEAAQHYAGYTVDTGSLGLVTPLSELPASQAAPNTPGPLIGPGPRGTQFYDSSGLTFTGYYYLAPVTFATSDGGTAQTVPIMVLAVDKAFCSGTRQKECEQQHPNPQPDLH